jgi:hypothetical protein
MLDEAASVHDADAQRRENRVDARWSSVPCHSLQNDGNSDASRLRLKGQGRTLEDDHDGEVGPD